MTKKFGLLESPPAVVETIERMVGGANLHIRLFAPSEEVARRSVGRRWDPISNTEVQLTDFTPPKEVLAFERLVEMDLSEDPAATIVARCVAFDQAQEEVDKFLEFFVQPCRVVGEAEGEGQKKRFPLPEGVAHDQSMPRLVEIGSDSIEGLDEFFEKACHAIDLVLEAEDSIHEFNKKSQAAAQAAEAETRLKKEMEEKDLDENFPEDGEILSGNDGDHEVKKFTSEVQEHTATADGTGDRMITLPSLTEMEEAVMLKIDDKIQNALLVSWRGIAKETVEQATTALFVELQLRGNLSKGLKVMQDEMIEILSSPDERGVIVDKFICESNDLYKHYKTLVETEEEVKAELHHRLSEMADKLFKLSNNKRKFASERRQKLMNSGWVEARLVELATIYQRLVNMELRRFWASDQLLQDSIYNASNLGFALPSPIPTISPDIVQRECTTTESINPGSPGAEVKGCHSDFGRIRAWEGEAAPPAERDESEELPVAGCWSFPFVPVIFFEAIRKMPSISAPVDPFASNAQAEAAGNKNNNKKKANAKGEASSTPAAIPENPPPILLGLAQARVELRTKFIFDLMRLRRWASERAHEIVKTADEVFIRMDTWISARLFAENEACESLEEHFGRLIEAGEPIAYRINADEATTIKALINDVIYDAPVDLKIPAALGNLEPQLE
eukprot:GDKK01043989.1.p1 GENE.GDKK01043989.1~~GDKK01043989.1.p1  ORF type:complete len:676 (+),score=182.17 GDKK01043989.1:28-2055(+)